MPSGSSDPGERPRLGTLVCAECGKQADEAAEGWRAFLTSNEPEEVATFCPVLRARVRPVVLTEGLRRPVRRYSCRGYASGDYLRHLRGGKR